MRSILLALVVLAALTPLPARPDPPPTRPWVTNQIPRLRELDFRPFNAALATFTAAQEAAVDRIVSAGDIAAIEAAMHRGTLSSRGLTLYYLTRLRREDGRLRTLIELNPRALDEADAADARRRHGDHAPLLGIPITLKDNIDVAGLHTTAGSIVLADNVARADAPLVARLRRGGAVLLGKANLSELAGSVTLGPRLGGASPVAGQVMNPTGDFATGGSSAGSAAGVAARLTLASIGTETSGSIMAPASWAGVVGFKPTRGWIAGAGIVPLALVNDTPGPITLTVADAARLFAAMGGPRARLSPTALRGAGIGVLRDDILAVPGNAALLQRVEAALRAAGARSRPVTVRPWSASLGDAPMTRLVGAGFRFDFSPYLATHGASASTPEALLALLRTDLPRRAPFGVDALERYISVTAGMTRADHAAFAATMRSEARARLEAAFAAGHADILVSFENYHSSAYATAGYPAITVPIGRRESGGDIAPWNFPTRGMPVGVTFIGRAGDDARLLAFAYAFERAYRSRVVGSRHRPTS